MTDDSVNELMERMAAEQEAREKARADRNIDWIEAFQVVRETEAEVWSRHTNQVVFTFFPRDESELHQWAHSYGEEEAAQAQAEKLVASFIADAGIEPEIEHRVMEGSGGRGADWTAILMILTGVSVAGPPVVNAWFDMARNVASVWNRLRRTDRAPLLSLGALILLCTADLRSRVHSDLDGVVLVAARDLGPRDMTHSGNDSTIVVFASDSRTWLYLVDPYGRVLHFAEFGRLPVPQAYQAGLECFDEDVEYPSLLDGDEA